MDTTEINKLTIGEIVANDFRASTVFKDAGIDFCCGGNQDMTEACNNDDIKKQKLIKELTLLNNSSIEASLNFKEWELGFLCDYIVNTHHKFVTKKLPEIFFYTEKIASVHGDHHPELIEVAQLFKEINKELTQHLKNEEDILFPAIKDVVLAGSKDSKALIISEISRMSKEHEFAGGAMDKINEITSGYKLPDDACNTYQVAFKMLEEFEDDLHVHVHLENNILYPKSLIIAAR